MSSKGHRWKVPNRRPTIRTPEQRVAFAEAIRQGHLKNRPSLEERFWAKVDKRGDEECWPWLSTKSRDGYGQVNVRGRMRLAHRVGWMLIHGEDPGELHVLHRCDNPPCQNPSHWFKGTHLDNMRDRDAKGRVAKGDRSGVKTKPENFRGSKRWIPQKLTREDVVEIRRLRSEGKTLAVLADQFRVTPAMISRIFRRVAWSHVP